MDISYATYNKMQLYPMVVFASKAEIRRFRIVPLIRIKNIIHRLWQLLLHDGERTLTEKQTKTEHPSTIRKKMTLPISNIAKDKTDLLSASKLILFWSVVLVCLPAPGLGAPFNLSEIAPGIHVHQGQQVGLDSAKRGDIANIGFIIGEACVAVVDSGGSIKTGRKLRKALRKVTKKPICYIINTHVHYDHVLGNHAFSRDKVKIVGHHKSVAVIENNRDFFLESFSAELGKGAKPDWIKGPHISVNKTKDLELGNRKIRLIAHPSAHTNTDLSVYDAKTSTLWAADLLFVDRIPVLSGSINGWLKELNAILSRDIAQVIPGHGPVPSDWRAAINAQFRYLETLRREIRSIIKNGGFLEEALQSVGHNEKGRWLLYEKDHKRNISRAFAELEWE